MNTTDTPTKTQEQNGVDLFREMMDRLEREWLERGPRAFQHTLEVTRQQRRDLQEHFTFMLAPVRVDNDFIDRIDTEFGPIYLITKDERR